VVSGFLRLIVTLTDCTAAARKFKLWKQLLLIVMMDRWHEIEDGLELVVAARALAVAPELRHLLWLHLAVAAVTRRRIFAAATGKEGSY